MPNINLKTVLETQPNPSDSLYRKTFIVKDYQRGYRWSKSQIVCLLEDVRNFDTQNDKLKYCMQPLVVKKETCPLSNSANSLSNMLSHSSDAALSDVWELIDGQQRLTTIFDVFKQFFNYVRSLNKPVDYIGEMENLIQSYVSSKDEFINLLIKVPALFEYMKKNTYRIDSTRNKRIVLLSKEQLNAYYAEVYTYALKIKLEEEGYIVDYHYGRGYFNVPTSESYIENISAPNPSSVHYQNIKYENGRFTVDGMLLTDANGNEIGKVDDAIQVI